VYVLLNRKLVEKEEDTLRKVGVELDRGRDILGSNNIYEWLGGFEMATQPFKSENYKKKKRKNIYVFEDETCRHMLSRD
jgi:hypothetical protein